MTVWIAPPVQSCSSGSTFHPLYHRPPIWSFQWWPAYLSNCNRISLCFWHIDTFDTTTTQKKARKDSTAHFDEFTSVSFKRTREARRADGHGSSYSKRARGEEQVRRERRTCLWRTQKHTHKKTQWHEWWDSEAPIGSCPPNCCNIHFVYMTFFLAPLRRVLLKRHQFSTVPPFIVLFCFCLVALVQQKKMTLRSLQTAQWRDWRRSTSTPSRRCSSLCEWKFNHGNRWIRRRS